MIQESDIRNILYLNVNSESGTAIGKCGSRGSSLTDLDITAGFITASQQLSKEMVKSDEVSKYNWEDLKGGSKRLTLYTTWGNEISTCKQNQNAIPVITSMLQVSGPEMDNQEYNNLLRFLRNINDEIVYRFMLGELSKVRTIDPLINIDIISKVLNNFNFSKKGRLIEKKSDKLNRLINQKLSRILKKDSKIIGEFLSKIPLTYSCMQEEYVKRVKEVRKIINNEINEFLEAEKKLDFFRENKIYGRKNTFSQLRELYNSYLDKQESYFEKKRALMLSLEEWYTSLNDLQIQLKDSLSDEGTQKIVKLQKILPKPNELDDFIVKIQEEYSDKNELNSLKEIQNRLDFNELEIKDYLLKKNIIKANQIVSYLKNVLETLLSLIDDIAQYKGTKEIEKLYNIYSEINQEEVPYDKGITTEDKVSQDFKGEVKNTIRTLRKNIVTKVINSLYDEIFNSYRKFKHVIVYDDDIKKFIISETISYIKSIFNKVQDFSFAAILEKTIRKVEPNTLTKHYSISLLKSFLQNYLYDNYIKNPFLINKKNPIVALDSYSLKFCSELINETGLNKDIYKAIDNLKLSEENKESFVQILDSFGLTRDKVAQELQNSSELFESWINKIDDLIENLGVNPQKTSIEDFLGYWEHFINTEGKYDEKTKNLKYFIKETILRNTEPHTKKREDLVKTYSSKTEIYKIVQELEKIEKSSEQFFGRREFNKLIRDSKTIIANKLSLDKENIIGLLNSITNLVDDKETEKLNQLLNKITDARELIKDDQKLKDFESGIKGIVKYTELEKILKTLDKLENEFLKLDGYAHVKGMIKTVTHSEPLIKESNIEKKHKSRDLLMDALVETYAHIYEDYFGKFIIQDIERLDKKKLGNIVKAGKLFNKQYKKVTRQLQLQNGLTTLKKVFESIEYNKSKFRHLNLDFLMNYLADYSVEKNFSSAEEFIRSFNAPEIVDEFLDYIEKKFSNSRKRDDLKLQLEKFYDSTVNYIRGYRSTKPKQPFELKIFNHEAINILYGIHETVYPGERSFFQDGRHPRKDHPSRKFNLKKVPKKRIDAIIEDINNLENILQYDLHILKKVFTYRPQKITPRDTIIEQVSNNLKDTLRSESEKHGFDKFEFESINRIRIMALLNTEEYDVPRDIKMNLILKSKYNHNYIKSLIKASTRISDLLRLNMNSAISKNSILNDVLLTKIVNHKTYGNIIKLPIKIPSTITHNNLSKIFGKNAVWAKNRTQLLGFKLPFDTHNKKTFGEAMMSSVYQDVSNELKPIINFLNKYSRKIHTGFDLVYKKLYE